MKKIITSIVIATTLLGCQNAIDSFTDGQMTAANTFQTVDDLQKGLNAAYGSIGMLSEYELASVFTDECGIGFANGGQGLTENYVFFLNSTSGSPEGIWANHYNLINTANRVIEGASFISPDATNQDTYNAIIGQAYALRAFGHLQLLAYFTTDLKDMNAFGVMLSTKVPKSNDILPRSTNGDIYQQIFTDLDTAETLLPGSNSDVYYIDTNFVNGLRARAYLYKGDYPKALQFSNAVINSGISLSSGNDYKNMFHVDQATNTENVLKLKRIQGNTGVGSVWASLNATVSGSPFYEIGRALFNDLLTTQKSGASTFTVSTVSANKTITTTAAHNLQVNDMIVTNVTRAGLTAGKPYFVNTTPSATTFTVSASYGGAQITTLNNGTGLNTGANALTAKSNYGDVRYSTIVAVSSVIDPNYTTSTDFRNTDKLVIGKHPGTAVQGALNNDVKIMRLSEMFLIKAEAQAGDNDFTSAASTLKTLRDARVNRPTTPDTYASKADAFRAILQERKIEMAFEGSRFLDLKRLGVITGTNIVRDPKDCANNSNACSLQAGDYRFALPIPLSESNANSIIRNQQNPGYSN